MDPIQRAAKIKDALYVRGISLSDIDREFALPIGTASTTLREPNAKGEVAIAAALAVEPHALWIERYEPGGQRREPQPRENYRRPPTLRQRRNDKAA